MERSVQCIYKPWEFISQAYGSIHVQCPWCRHMFNEALKYHNKYMINKYMHVVIVSRMMQYANTKEMGCILASRTCEDIFHVTTPPCKCL